MAGASALLRSAASRRATIQNEQNRMIDLEWQLSAKTAGDYEAYIQHYQNAMQSADVSNRLTYQNKIISARKAFTSSEIQRQSINVLEGNATNQDKLNTMVSFYQQAVDNGDMASAQSLNLQIDNLYKTIQTEQQASMNLATQAYNAGYTTAKAYVDDLKNGTVSPFADDPQLTMRNLNEELLKQGPETMSALVQEVSKKYGLPMASFEDMALYMADNTIANTQTYRDQYPVGSAEYNNLDNEVNNLKTKFKFDLPGVSVTYDTLKAAAENVRAGMPSAISLQSTANGYEFVANKVANWSVMTDANGNAVLAPNYVQPNDAGLNNPTSNMAAGGAGYTLVTQDLGGGQSNTYAVLPNGDMYDVKGFNPAKPKNKVGNLKDFQNNELAQQQATPEEALQKLGYKADSVNVYLPDENGRETRYQYNVDQNGNVQFYRTLTDKATGDTSSEVYTIDTKTGATHTGTMDLVKYQAEQKRLSGLTSGPSNTQDILQNQKNAAGILQPAGASQMLQSAKNVQTTMKAQQIQQAASAQQISQLPAQPLKVAPMPQAPAISVQPLPQAQPLSVQPVPKAPSVSVYQAPITQGTAPKVTVVDKPNTTKLVVR